MRDPLTGKKVYQRMKTIEDIEKLTPEDLERMADDETVAVPENLEQGIENRILAFEMARNVEAEEAGDRTVRGENTGDRTQKNVWRRWAFIPAAAAAVAAVIVGLNFYDSSRTPAETFSTPEEAYAQVEKTFAMIGSKVGKGKSIADAAVPKMHKTHEILNNNQIILKK